jgi:hypothetical protein
MTKTLRDGHRPHPFTPVTPLTTDTRPLFQINNQCLLGVVQLGGLWEENRSLNISIKVAIYEN